MPTLFLICGLPGSGKTTLARRLEIERTALRLTPDEWIAKILENPLDKVELDRLRNPVESIQWEVAARALTLGLNVVLDFGFWTKEERSSFRRRGEERGARVEIHACIATLDELWARASARNESLPPGTFSVDKSELEFWWSLFEPPSPDELSVSDAMRAV